MRPTNRRALVRSLGTLLPAAVLAQTAQAPAAAKDPGGAKGEPGEARAQEFIASVKPAVVLLEVERDREMAWGTGFFVSSDGLVVTSRHAVKDSQKVTCLYRNQTKLPARVLTVDDQYDLAIIKVDLQQPVATVVLGDSDRVAEGLLVAATGYPATKAMVFLGMAIDSSTSRGCVNAIRSGGDVHTYYGDRVLQIDTPISPGNWGGPVTRLDTGEVIGIVTGGAENLTFALPVNRARVLLNAVGWSEERVRLIPPHSSEAVLEPGDVGVLNTVSVSMELPRHFAFPFSFTPSFRENTDPVDDWERAAGERPAPVTPLVLHDNELFFGATDGTLRQWNLDNLFHNPPVVLLATGKESIILYPPVVTDDRIVVAAGGLQLTPKDVNKVTAKSVLRAVFTFGLGGASESRRVIRIEGEGSLVGLNRRNGSIEWSHDTGWVGTPVLFSGNIYYGGMGERGALEATDGSSVWKHEKREGPQTDFFHIGYAGALGILGVAVPVEAKWVERESNRTTLRGDGKVRVESYDPASGKVIWKTEFGNLRGRPEALGTTMFIDESNGIIYALASQVIAAVEAKSGKLLWTYDHAEALQEAIKKAKGEARKKEIAKSVTFSPMIAFHEGFIYIGSADKRLYALNARDGKVAWAYNTRGPVGHPYYHEGQVLVGSGDGYIHSVDAKKGHLAWRVLTRGGGIASQPLVYQGKVFAATTYGEIQIVRIPRA